MIHNVFDKIISLDNLFSAWSEFRKGKRHKLDVQTFEFNLEDNIFKLHWLLKTGRYQHGNYVSFCVKDPKPRIIHKAPVVDRVLHHAIFRVLYPIFDEMFINDSYSCRINKGTHKAVKQLGSYIQKVSRNYQQNCFVLKCDIKKFFHSIDHQILLSLIQKKITDDKAMDLI
ncbi:MAG: RNA-directed DNA polymerase (Reverse transcriptase) [Parcubacteria group bacterium GW2011_GWC2_39_14]|nr:MAG: RNA-directed DNA polymerase (Reverse transcriptase) [Parcubacteria group bacterium GW2011_GWC2_39_14]